MSSNRVFNFNPGPSMMPVEVLEEVRQGFMDFGGMSVLEISHRSNEFDKIIGRARELISELMGIPKGYQVLFLHGGAATQFAMVPLNLMDKSADYSVTGRFSELAVGEAKHIGKPRIAFSSEEVGYCRVPHSEELITDENASYLHITSNNTVCGTQYRTYPTVGVAPLVADMSSDILSRKIDVSKFGLIYAGAQKNLGPAGVTVVIIKDDLVEKQYRKVPDVFKYSSHVKSKSLFNTPSVFSVYVLSLMLEWLKRKGGVDVIEITNNGKADLLYKVMDKSEIYEGKADVDSRSKMNITFSLPTDELNEKFISEAQKNGFVGLKGHRSLGGIRLSIYNAFPIEGVKAFVQFMEEFERTA